MSNYALDTPIKRNVDASFLDIPFAPAYTPSNAPETDQTHRAMTWQFDKRQQVIGTQEPPKSGRLEKKK
jgi:hypothetical protein